MLPSADKVMRLQKFASGIFIPRHQAPYAASQNEIHLFVRAGVKPATDQQLQGRSSRVTA
jgi:hypothetical protein